MFVGLCAAFSAGVLFLLTMNEILAYIIVVSGIITVAFGLSMTGYAVYVITD